MKYAFALAVIATATLAAEAVPDPPQGRGRGGAPPPRPEPPEIADHTGYVSNRQLGGLIGFEMHVGPPKTVEFRNIWLKPL